MYLILVVLCALVYLVVLRPKLHWKHRRVSQAGLFHVWWHIIKTILSLETTHKYIKEEYLRFKNQRYSGVYHIKFSSLLIRDPELIKQITVTDFDYFTDHRSLTTSKETKEAIDNIFNQCGNKWRTMRKLVLPAYTNAKMQIIFDLMNECAQEFTNNFMQKGNTTLEVQEAFQRYSSDIIATCAFGVKFDSLRQKDNKFFQLARESLTFKSWNKYRALIVHIFPKLTRFLGPPIRSKFTHYFVDTLNKSIKSREENRTMRFDMLHFLLQAKKGTLTYERDESPSKLFWFNNHDDFEEFTQPLSSSELEDCAIIGQIMLFFYGGFKTVSTLMSFMAYELALNPDIQKRLRDEVDNTKRNCNGNLTYDDLMDMKYMDMVISETLRKWPPNSHTNRQCVKPYTIAPKLPGERTLHLNVGDTVIIPITGLHNDTEYFKNPEVFDPERYNDFNKERIRPYTYLPFGVGPRCCLGFRFAIMETKTIFYHLLSKFEIIPRKITKQPMNLVSFAFTLEFEKGLILNFKKR